MPLGVPVSFRLTSDTVMNSLYIPQLGGQVYAMAGMKTRLNLVADRPGTFDGMSSQFSGEGFSSMRFHAIGMSGNEFDQWVHKVRQSAAVLSRAGYERLAIPAAPGADPPTRYFSSVQPHLFEDIVNRYAPAVHPAAMSAPESTADGQGDQHGHSASGDAKVIARR
jgi:cytochrome o ubiquinol oxidase subunit 2